MKEITTAICPKCGQEYTGRPALSREDGSILELSRNVQSENTQNLR